MSATPEDVQAKLDSALSAIEAASETYAAFVKKHGSDWAAWPKTTRWYIFRSNLAAARDEAGQLVAPSDPTPTPTRQPTPQPTPVPVGALIFGDEFDGSTLDTTKWAPKSGKAGNGLGYWDATKARLDGNSNLVITAELVSGVWHTAFISGKKSISGPRYIEARAKLPEVAGNWSAPTWEWAYPYGANGLEVDVNEQLGDQPGEYHFTLHNWDAGKQKGVPITTGANLADWHTYGCAVHADHADAYFDGQLVGQPIKASDIGYADLTSHQVCENIDLNMGGWGGSVSGSGPFEMVVDYLHVYELAS